jgi:DNA-binding HxlR family transcriptional regulator
MKTAVKKTDRPTAARCTGILPSVSDALYAIGGKWKLRIIIALAEGSKRFNDLRRVLDGISARVLSAELKDLELTGFIKRTVHTDTPVVVEYEITEYSESLRDIMRALHEWGVKHRTRIRQSMKTASAN